MKRRLLSILLCAFLVTSSVLPCSVYADEEETASEQAKKDTAGDEEKEEESGDSSSDEKSSADEVGESGDDNGSEAGESSASDSGESSSSDSGESQDNNSEAAAGDEAGADIGNNSAENTGMTDAEPASDNTELPDSLPETEPAADISDEEIIHYEIVDDEEQVDEVLRTEVDEDGNTVVVVGTEELVLEEETEILDFDVTDAFEVTADKAEAPSVADKSWDKYAVSYEYNWDNSQNCWYWGMYGNGECYKTEEGTYDANVRHKVGLYCDGENVYFMIQYAKANGAFVCNSDYNFTIDGQQAKFTVAFSDDNSGIQANRPAGEYDVTILNGDSASSSYEAYGTVGTLYVTDDNVSNVLEMKIPLSTLKLQNPNINIDNFSMVGFYDPNLTYRTVSCAGAGNSAVPFAIGSFLIFAGALYSRRRTYGRILYDIYNC